MKNHSTAFAAALLVLLTLGILQAPSVYESTGNALSGALKTHLGISPPPFTTTLKFETRLPELSHDELQSLQAGSRPLTVPIAPSGAPPAQPGVPGVDAVSPRWGNVNSTDFAVFENTGLHLPNSAQKSLVNEPSVAQKNQIIFYTGNWYAARSTNGGLTWSYVSPFTGMSDFCCDQDTIYNPSRGIFLWYRMGKNSTGGSNRVLLGVSTDALTWWFYNIHPTDLNSAWTGQFFDFVVLAYSDNYLYVTTNLFKSSIYQSSVILRLSLEKLKNNQPFAFDIYAVPNTGFAPVQGAKQTMYFASHVTTAILRIYVWSESSTSLSSIINIAHLGYKATDPGSASCPDADGGDICKRLDDRVLGGWVANSTMGFLWNVAQGVASDGSFSEPYTYIIRLNETRVSTSCILPCLIDTPLLYNQSYAWVYTWASPNARGDLGLVAFTAGHAIFPTLNVGILDSISGNPPPWHFYRVANSTNGPETSCLSGSNYQCWGDYIRVRPYNGTGNAWTATGYTLNGGFFGGNTGTFVQPWYVVFGRVRDDPFKNSTVTFLTSPSVVGSITFNGTTYTNGQSRIYNLTNYSATANYPTNYNFSRWQATGGIIVSNPRSNSTNVTLLGPGNLTAILIPPNVTVTFHSTPSNGGAVTCEGRTFNDGQTGLLPANSTIPCIANPAKGYHFASWSGLATGTSMDLYFFTGNGGTLKANFGVGTATISPIGLGISGILVMFFSGALRRKKGSRFSRLGFRY